MAKMTTENQYQLLFERSADAMLIIEEQRFVDCNQAALDMLGYQSREALLAIRPGQISPQYQPDGRTSEEKADELIPLAFEQGSLRFEWIHLRENGEEFPVEVLLTAITHGNKKLLHVVWHDISERKQAEERLRLAKYVIDNTSEGVVISDTNSMIVEVNPAYCEIMGFKREEVIGRPTGISKSDRHDRSFYQDMWASILKDGRWSGEIWDRHKTGRIFPKHLKIDTAYDSNNKPKYYVGVFSDISDLKRAEEQLEHLAFSDPLTGLPNRALFLDRLNQALSRAQREGSSLALLFIDLDRFKNANDTLGHSAGDQILCQVANIYRKIVRESDTVARMGGDEFTVILSDLVDEDEASQVAQKLVDALKTPLQIHGMDVSVNASIGISLYPHDGQSLSDLMRSADLAMYRAKDLGGGQYSYYSAELNTKVLRQMVMEREIRIGIENDEFVPFYQLKVDAATGDPVGLEALARWRKRDGQLISPANFISIAEDTGLILPLSEQILCKVCEDLKIWMEELDQPLPVAINLSMRQFHNQHLLHELDECLEKWQIPASLLEVEITETMMVGNQEQTGQMLMKLKERGLQISIDDFGTGYSSLNRLKALPIDTVKIDMSFIRDILTDPSDLAIVRAIISMTQNLGLNVIAEGVENQQQAELLLSEGCHWMQGYFFSKPLPKEELPIKSNSFSLVQSA